MTIRTIELTLSPLVFEVDDEDITSLTSVAKLIDEQINMQRITAYEINVINDSVDKPVSDKLFDTLQLGLEEHN